MVTEVSNYLDRLIGLARVAIRTVERGRSGGGGMAGGSGTGADIGADIVDRLPIPRPFTLERFARGLSELRGRTVELVAARLGASAPYGLLVSTDDVDYVCYAGDTSALHQLHIILHEVGHLELGHTSRRITVRSASTTTPEAGAAGDPLRAFEKLLPRLSPALIRRLLGRTAYLDVDEQEAEVYATLAGERIDRVIDPFERTTPRDLGLAGLQTIFDIPRACGDVRA